MGRKRTLRPTKVQHNIHLESGEDTGAVEDQERLLEIQKRLKRPNGSLPSIQDCFRLAIRAVYDRIDFFEENEELKHQLSLKEDEKEFLIKELAAKTAELEEFKLKETFSKKASKNPYSDIFNWLAGWIDKWDLEPDKEGIRPLIVERANEIKTMIDRLLEKIDNKPKLNQKSEPKSTTGAV
ncbi:hypothetical protein [Methanococcus maripaludis]|uniref:Uncharacterized protein n=1 Tax=Methanococcus maripaludis TaxID=39152 RepID=A0A8T4H2U1_METMI|nr:hypothetical protein [Methanococcus maripaludis]MBM7408799.1 hypothetical protein [Methanococcus maripaludis]MBP2219032.1 hypothetical protein [Methanococcus maripaludis]